LPESVWVVDSLPTGEGNPPSGEQIGLKDILGRSSVVIAPTELSATAPLKILARKMSFRGATLPGFTQQMLPALSLDYEEIHARVMEIKRRMDESVSISCVFKTSKGEYQFTADTRFRTGHASGGLIREAQSVGNLPSGEAYIVPYEGERGEPSLTSGLLPVQFGEEIVIYKVAENRVTSVLSSGESSRKESDLLSREPAYGNIAEVGIGVLGEWGVLPAGSILLDEKLGLHIAFGRSDHFGGVTGPASFRDPANVVHIDRVYVPSLQPGIHPSKVEFMYPSGESEIVIKDGALKI
jgi:leucyl aminopeptidase (aminopeptidase T)